MFKTVLERVLVVVLGVLMVAGAALGIYAAAQHSKMQALQIEQLQKDVTQERAATTAALQAASALGAALDAKAAAQTTATQNHAALTTRLASAVAAAPAVASTVVPESYWLAIYGGDNAK
jgi:disulfide bond formation protein DsbB